MYENYKLCDSLKPSEICLVIEQCNDGVFTREFHEHVPKWRISDEACVSLLRAFVIRFWGFSGMGVEQIVRCHLNAQSQTPAADKSLRITVSYPEAGVLRKYCGGNTVAWFDRVFSPKDFRQ
jgi:hypothetical protein